MDEDRIIFVVGAIVLIFVVVLGFFLIKDEIKDEIKVEHFCEEKGFQRVYSKGCAKIINDEVVYMKVNILDGKVYFVQDSFEYDINNLKVGE